MLAHALFEISALTLIAASSQSSAAPSSWGSRSATCVDGLTRRMRLFDATSRTGWMRLLDDFIASLQRSVNERSDWESLSASANGSSPTTTATPSSAEPWTGNESPSGSTVASLRKHWGDLFSAASRFTTSTSPSPTTTLPTSTCAEIVLTISECITPWIASFPNCWNADTSGSTARQVLTSYARSTSSSLFGELDRIQFWFDVAEQSDAYEFLARRARGRRACEVLLEPESGGGHPAPRPEAWAGVAGSVADGAGVAGPLTRRYGKGVNTTVDDGAVVVSHTLRSEGFDASEDGTGRGTPLVVNALTRDIAGAGGDADDNTAQGGHLVPVGFHMTQDPIHSNGGTPALGRTTSGMGVYAPGGSTASADQARTLEVLRTLREALGEEAFAEWCARVIAPLRSPEVLRAVLHGTGLRLASEAVHRSEDGAAARLEDGASWAVFAVREAARLGRSSPRPQPAEQRARELGAHLPLLPHPGAQARALLLYLRSTPQGARLLREALPALEEVGRSAAGKAEPTHAGVQSGLKGGPGLGVRRLTPRLRECERLQSLPDGWTAPPGLHAPDGRRYAAVGDAVTSNVAQWIGERLLRFGT